MSNDTVQFGRVTRIGACCNKPVGCTMCPPGCLWKRHPWKRANVFGDTTAPCQAKSYPTDPESGEAYEMTCTLPSDGHQAHEMKRADK